MAHPFAHHARKTGHHKMRSMHKSGGLPNKVLPIMHAVGENQSGGIRESSSSMQLKRQAGASGMKRGGKFGHHKSKAKPDMAALMASQAQASPPGPDAMGASGAGGAPAPVSSPMPPMQKHGGKVGHSDEAADKALFKKMMAAHEAKEMKVHGTLKHKGHKRGGRLPLAGHNTHGGAISGVGRLEKVHTGHMKRGGRHHRHH